MASADLTHIAEYFEVLENIMMSKERQSVKRILRVRKIGQHLKILFSQQISQDKI